MNAWQHCHAEVVIKSKKNLEGVLLILELLLHGNAITENPRALYFCCSSSSASYWPVNPHLHATLTTSTTCSDSNGWVGRTGLVHHEKSIWPSSALEKGLPRIH